MTSIQMWRDQYQHAEITLTLLATSADVTRRELRDSQALLRSRHAARLSWKLLAARRVELKVTAPGARSSVGACSSETPTVLPRDPCWEGRESSLRCWDRAGCAC